MLFVCPNYKEELKKILFGFHTEIVGNGHDNYKEKKINYNLDYQTDGFDYL